MHALLELLFLGKRKHTVHGYFLVVMIGMINDYYDV